MQQTTIGGDSDGGGSERPRRKARRGAGQRQRPDKKANRRARAERAAAPATDSGRTGEEARRSGNDDSDRD
eukprot:scaffold22115_cov51-Phaeocystis_antarctica.AAC.1